MKNTKCVKYTIIITIDIDEFCAVGAYRIRPWYVGRTDANNAPQVATRATPTTVSQRINA